MQQTVHYHTVFVKDVIDVQVFLFVVVTDVRGQSQMYSDGFHSVIYWSITKSDSLPRAVPHLSADLL